MASVTFMLAALLVWHFVTDIDWDSYNFVRSFMILATGVLSVLSMIMLYQ